ncbi:MAG: signal peptidase II [Rickettsiaceae bacterium]
MIKRLSYYSVLLLSLICIDQISKSLVVDYLPTQSNYTKTILPFLDLIYAWNHGISFGLFHQYYQHSNLVFLILNSLIILYLFYVLYQSSGFLYQSALILIIGGALGNLLDRIFRGAVFDFIYLHYQEFYFPAFNLADSFISIGGFLLIVNYCQNLYIQSKKGIKK